MSRGLEGKANKYKEQKEGASQLLRRPELRARLRRAGGPRASLVEGARKKVRSACRGWFVASEEVGSGYWMAAEGRRISAP